MSPVLKRSLPKKQKLICTSTGKISNINGDANNGSNIQKDNDQRENPHEGNILKTDFKTELIENNDMEKNIRPLILGATGSIGPDLNFFFEFSDNLNNHLNNKARKISSLEADLKLSNHLLQETKNNLQNERAEKEKIAEELSELQKTHNDVLEVNKTTQMEFWKVAQENTSLKQQLDASKSAYEKFKTGSINFLANFNPLADASSKETSNVNSNCNHPSDTTDSNVSNTESAVSMSSPQDTDNGI